jgi:hypothetical protein
VNKLQQITITTDSCRNKTKICHSASDLIHADPNQMKRQTRPLCCYIGGKVVVCFASHPKGHRTFDSDMLNYDSLSLTCSVSTMVPPQRAKPIHSHCAEFKNIMTTIREPTTLLSCVRYYATHSKVSYYTFNYPSPNCYAHCGLGKYSTDPS